MKTLSEYQLKVAALKHIMNFYGVGLPEAIFLYNRMTYAARDNAARKYLSKEGIL